MRAFDCCGGPTVAGSRTFLRVGQAGKHPVALAFNGHTDVVPNRERAELDDCRPLGAERDSKTALCTARHHRYENPVWAALPPRPSGLFRDTTRPTDRFVLAITGDERSRSIERPPAHCLDTLKRRGRADGTFVLVASRRCPTLWARLIKKLGGGVLNAHFA